MHMETVSIGNRTITEFVLLGFYDIADLHLLFFTVFTLVYTSIIIGNMLIIVAVVRSQKLHTPMYFFLANLSFVDTCYSSAITPKMLVDLLSEKINHLLCWLLPADVLLYRLWHN